MGGCNRNALGAIDGRTATYGNQAIAALGLVHRHGRAHGGFGGVGRGLVENGQWQAGQGVQRFLQHPGGFHAGVGHDQGRVMPTRSHSWRSSCTAPNSNWIWVT